MIDPSTYTLLQDIIRRESRSLLQYVQESFPWTTPEECDALAQLEKIIDEERQGATALARFLIRHHLQPPYLGTYPEPFTNLNYVTLDHLLPMLVEEQRRSIQVLEGDLPRLNNAEAQEQVRKIIDAKRRHLAELEKLQIANGKMQAATQ